MLDANSPHYRPVHPDEYEDALTLWETVFGAGSRDYFRRYFTADPWYQPGDCLGAWLDDRLVSCVHICPRLLGWRGGLMRCGGIANVATLPEYRGRGLSRALLAQTLEVMWETGCGFSLLFTERHRHYSALGWERVETPRPSLTLYETPGPPLLDIQPAIPDSEIIRLYEHSPRPPLLAQRTAPPPVDGAGKQYFTEWVGWRWQSSRAEMLVLPERGYLVHSPPPDPEQTANATTETPPLEIWEWRALDAVAEMALLRAAAAHAWDRGQTRVGFPHIPQLVGMEALTDLGIASFSAPEGYGMTRNIALPDAEYEEIKQLYTSGFAPWFAADGF